MAYLLERSMFNKQVFQSAEVITSAGIQERWQKAVQNRATKTPMTVRSDIWLLPPEKTASWVRGNYALNDDSSEKKGDSSTKNDDNSTKNDTSKVKLSKENNTLYNAPAREKGITEEQRNELHVKHGIPLEYIDKVIQKSANYRIKDLYETIIAWWKEDSLKQQMKRAEKSGDTTGSFNTDEFYEAALKRWERMCARQ